MPQAFASKKIFSSFALAFADKYDRLRVSLEERVSP
jgi:hypothetical protein